MLFLYFMAGYGVSNINPDKRWWLRVRKEFGWLFVNDCVVDGGDLKFNSYNCSSF